MSRAPLIIPLNGVERSLHPLELTDLGAVANKMGAKAIKAAMLVAAENPGSAAADAVLDRAFKYAATVEIMGRDMAMYLSGVEGLLHLMVASISKGDPKFTEKDALAILTDPVSRLAFAKAVGTMLPASDGDTGSDPTPGPEGRD